jgi:ribonuclease HI
VLKRVVEIFADGSSDGTSTGVGGWGAIIRCDGVDKEVSGFSYKSTNNRMELTAVIKALRCLEDISCSDVMVCTDSQYVKNGITEWIKRWKRNGWRNSERAPVKNKDLWLRLDKLVAQYCITWTWVRGHTNHPENERCDQLAKEARIKGKQKLASNS